MQSTDTAFDVVTTIPALFPDTAVPVRVTAVLQNPDATIGRIRVDENHGYSFVVGTATNGAPLTAGLRTQRTLLDEVRFYEITVPQPYRNVVPTFGRVRDAWFLLCARCGHTGYWGHGPDNGRCYDCRGVGMLQTVTRDEMAKYARDFAARERRSSDITVRRMAARAAARAAWLAANAELVAWVKSLTPDETETVYVEGGGTMLVESFGKSFSGKAARMIQDVRDGGDLDEGKLGGDDTRFLGGVHRREMQRAQAAAAQAAAGPTGRFAGEVDARVEITGKVTARRMLEEDSRGNTKFLIAVTGTGDDAGVVCKMFTVAKFKWNLREGDTVTLRATVKGHETYRGRRETLVGNPRVTVLESAEGNDDDE